LQDVLSMLPMSEPLHALPKQVHSLRAVQIQKQGRRHPTRSLYAWVATAARCALMAVDPVGVRAYPYAFLPVLRVVWLNQAAVPCPLLILFPPLLIQPLFPQCCLHRVVIGVLIAEQPLADPAQVRGPLTHVAAPFVTARVGRVPRCGIDLGLIAKSKRIPCG